MTYWYMQNQIPDISRLPSAFGMAGNNLPMITPPSDRGTGTLGWHRHRNLPWR